MSEELNISLVQYDIAWEDPEANYERVEKLILERELRSDIIVLPEMFNTGFTMEPAKIVDEVVCSRALDKMKAWAEKTGAVIAGSIAFPESGRFYNRFVAIFPSGKMVHYDKRHLFRMGDEHKTYSPGFGQSIFELKGWRIAPFICYDLRFPVWNRNVNNSYDLALYSANWPENRKSVWFTLLNARAIENQCYVAGVNRIGMDPTCTYPGGSILIDYKGNVLSEASSSDEGLLEQTFSLESLRRFREKFPAWMDADPFDIL